MTSRIVVLDPITEKRAEQLRAIFGGEFELSHATARGEDHLKSIIADADFAISGQVAVSGNVLRAAEKLKLLHKWGVGVDNFDLAAAAEMGIKVARTTGSNAIPVAETTIGLMLAVLRNIALGHATLQQGDWSAVRQGPESFMLSGKSVGIVGLGHVGKALVRLLKGFNCPVSYFKPHRLGEAEEHSLGVRYLDLPELMAQSDIVSLHCPLTPQTTGLIDRKALGSMKRTSILVNMARGGIVNETDLVWALQNRIIHAAASDVYEIEPLPVDSPLLKLPNLVTTPHLAAQAADNFSKSVLQMLGNIRRVQNGQPVTEADSVIG